MPRRLGATLARTSNAFAATQVAQLRQGCADRFARESRVLRHDFGRDWSWLDVDLTPSPISKLAEASTKGKFAKKTTTACKLARVQAPQYHETVFSRIYPGKQDSGTTYIPLLAALAPCRQLSAAQKQCTILRSDASFGADANVNQALTADWHVLGKGKGGHRPQAYAREIAAAA